MKKKLEAMINESEIVEYLEKLESQNLLRKLSRSEGTDFSSNDYLSLSRDPKSLEAGFRAGKKFGTGSTGSRLLSGNKEIFEDFEKRIARDKHSESALIFNSGYIANSSVMSAFSAMGYLLIFDKLNHASMYQRDIGFATFGKNPFFETQNQKSENQKTQNQNLKRFPHLDYEKLEEILEKYKDSPKKLIASETVFGMDGDKADIKILSELAEKYNAILYLDEAHATGLYGQKGYGLSTDFQLNPRSTIIMGTFSKALASNGAYVACSELFKDFLIQVSKGFIYSTALSPFCIGIAQHNWEMIQNLDSVRCDIFTKADYLRNGLEKLGFRCVGSGTNIVPIIFDSTEKMLATHKNLLNKKIITSAVRKPTSPTPRLRVAINAQHTCEDIDLLLENLK